jgi:hypothetical protein
MATIRTFEVMSVKLKKGIVPVKAYGGVDVYVHIFLTSALARDEWLSSCPCRFTLGERATSIHWIGGRVGPTAGLDDVEKENF